MLAKKSKTNLINIKQNRKKKLFKKQRKEKKNQVFK